MICRECMAETLVVETRGNRRRRECPNLHRFSTEELYREDLKELRHAAEQLAALRALLAVTPEQEDAQDSRPAPL